MWINFAVARCGVWVCKLVNEDILHLPPGFLSYVLWGQTWDFGCGSNLPEVTSTHEVLGVPSVSARFGTSPHIWNVAMAAVAALAPKVRDLYTCFHQCWHNTDSPSDILVWVSIDLQVHMMAGIFGRSEQGRNTCSLVWSMGACSWWHCWWTHVNEGQLLQTSLCCSGIQWLFLSLESCTNTKCKCCRLAGLLRWTWTVRMDERQLEFIAIKCSLCKLPCLSFLGQSVQSLS
jgi:hypothetical protein